MKYNFGQAIEALKSGKKIAHGRWEHMAFAYLVNATTIPSDRLRNEAKEAVAQSHQHIKILSHIDMKQKDGTIVIVWLPTTSELLSDDWYIVD